MSDYSFSAEDFDRVIKDNPIFNFIATPERIAEILGAPVEEVREYMEEETDFNLQIEAEPGDKVPSFLTIDNHGS